MRIAVGTSGYAYPEWRGSFYPERIKAKEMFPFYAERFRTVEINATFYRMPTPALTGAWRDQAPPGFTYTLKAPRRITHLRRLKDCEQDVRYFLDGAAVLGPHLATALFQLPPNQRADVGRLRTCLAAAGTDVRLAFEFRHDSWLTEPVYEALADHHAALCIADFGDRTTPIRPTARHAYFRLRDEGYSAEDLDRWAEVMVRRAEDWDEVFVYFKHEEAGKGPEFARAFMERLEARGLAPR